MTYVPARSTIVRIGAPWIALVCVACWGCSVPDQIEKRGNFQVEYFRTDAFGHTGTRRALYHMKGLSQRTRVTTAAVAFLIAPIDADRLIYETCDLTSDGNRYGEHSGCRHVYFDGHSGKNHTIGRGLKISMTPLEQTDRWSWNGRFAALGDQYELVIVDLQSGRATRWGTALRLEEPFYPQKWQHREVRWGQWSPDGGHGALIVMSPHGPGLPVLEWDEELYSLDAASDALTLVATHTGELGMTGERRLWREKDFRWDGTTLQPPR